MTYAQAIRFFGSQTKLADALDVSQPAVSCWGKVIPPLYQYQIEVMTRGVLRADARLRKRFIRDAEGVAQVSGL